VNIWTPFLVESVREYPVHCAAEGGNLELLRWLVDELRCPLYETTDGAAPLLTQKGDSVLGVAARYEMTSVMRWLVTVKECNISEIADRQQLWGTIDFLLREGSDGGGGQERRRSSSSRRVSSRRVSSSQSQRSRQQIIEEEEESSVLEEEEEDEGYEETDEDEQHRRSRRPPSTTAAAAPAAPAATHRESTSRRTRMEQHACLVCKKGDVDCAVLPCGHLCTCSGCALSCKECPACRTRVTRVVRV